MAKYPFTKQSLIAKVRSKYPQYAELPDDELFGALTNKYPQYAAMVDPDSLDAPAVSAPEPERTGLMARIKGALTPAVPVEPVALPPATLRPGDAPTGPGLSPETLAGLVAPKPAQGNILAEASAPLPALGARGTDRHGSSIGNPTPESKLDRAIREEVERRSTPIDGESYDPVMRAALAFDRTLVGPFRNFFGQRRAKREYDVARARQAQAAAFGERAAAEGVDFTDKDIEQAARYIAASITDPAATLPPAETVGQKAGELAGMLAAYAAGTPRGEAARLVGGLAERAAARRLAENTLRNKLLRAAAHGAGAAVGSELTAPPMVGRDDGLKEAAAIKADEIGGALAGFVPLSVGAATMAAVIPRAIYKTTGWTPEQFRAEYPKVVERVRTGSASQGDLELVKAVNGYWITRAEAGRTQPGQAVRNIEAAAKGDLGMTTGLARRREAVQALTDAFPVLRRVVPEYTRVGVVPKGALPPAAEPGRAPAGAIPAPPAPAATPATPAPVTPPAPPSSATPPPAPPAPPTPPAGAPPAVKTPAPAVNRFTVELPSDPDKMAHGVYRWRNINDPELRTATDSVNAMESGLQERDRRRAASDAARAQRLMKFRAKRMLASDTADYGAPLVDLATGRPVAGYGRLGTLADVWALPADDPRRTDLVTRLGEFGQAVGIGPMPEGEGWFIERAIDRYENSSAEDFAKRSNDAVRQGFSDAEKAVRDAKRLREADLVRLLNVPPGGDVLARQNQAFITAFLNGQDDAAEYMTADGRPAPALEGRIQRAIMTTLVSDAPEAVDAITALVERAADYGIKPMIKGLTAAAPRLLKVRMNRSAFDLTPQISAAMPELMRAKKAVAERTFRTIEDYFKQSDWSRTASEEDLRVAMMLASTKSDKELAEKLDDYAKVAEYAGEGTVDMFSDIPASTKVDILRRLTHGEDWNSITQQLNRRAEAAQSGAGNAGGGLQGEPPGPGGNAPPQGDQPGGVQPAGGQPQGGAAGDGGGARGRPAPALPGNRYDPLTGEAGGEVDSLLGDRPAPRVGEGGPVYRAADLFAVESPKSAVQVELERVAASRGVSRPGSIRPNDIDMLTTRSLQATAERLAGAVARGEMNPAEARKAWQAAQDNAAALRAREERRQKAQAAARMEAMQRPLPGVAQDEGAAGRVLEEGGGYVTDRDIEELADAQNVPERYRAEAVAEGRALRAALSSTGGTPYLPGLENAGGVGGTVSGADGVERPTPRRALSREEALAKLEASQWAAFDRGEWEQGFEVGGGTVSAILGRLVRREVRQVNMRGMRVTTPDHAAGVLAAMEAPHLIESFRVLYLDSRNAVIEARIVSLGILDTSLVHPREVFGAMPKGTAKIVLGHNHPSGDTTASPEDVRITRQMVAAARQAQVDVVDHVIVNGRFTSMRESNLTQFYAEAPWRPREVQKSEWRAAPDYSPERPWAIPTPKITAPEDADALRRKIEKALRPGRGGAIYTIGVNTRNRVVAVTQHDAAATERDIMAALLRESGRSGISAVVFSLPERPDGGAAAFARRVRDLAAPIGIKVLDVIESRAESPDRLRPYTSLREAGTVDFSDDSGAVRETPAPYAVSETPAPYEAGDKDARIVRQAARYVVGTLEGRGPTGLEETAGILTARWGEKIGPYIDRIHAEALSLGKNKELDYALAVKTGKLGAEGEAGAQGRAAGSGPAVAGATGGSGAGAGPRRRGDLRIAGAGHIPEPRNYVPADADVDDDQRLGINLALTRFMNGGRGFLLADGTGVGKTSQIILIADLWRKLNPERGRVLIVTNNQATIKGSFFYDARRLGIDLNRFDLTTYDGLKAGENGRGLKNLRQKGPDLVQADPVDLADEPYDVVIFDEAHNFKNLDSQKTIRGSKVLSKARHVLYATATPMDTPTGSVYFMGEVTGIPPERIGEMLGFSWVETTDPDTGEIRRRISFNPGVKGWKDVLKNLANLRNAAVEQGALIRREYPFKGSVMQLDADISAADLAFEQRIVEYFRQAYKRGPGAGQKTQASRHFVEALKIPAALKQIRESLAAGRAPILVTSFVNPSERLHAPPPMIETGGKPKPNWRYELWRKIVGEERTIPGVIQDIAAALDADGISYAKVWGSGDKSVEVSRFQGGRVRAVLMTPQSGGTGVNLDDVVGDRPRDLIIITPIFSGDVFQQVMGRVSRRNTASDARAIFINAPGTFGDDRARAIQRQKLDILTRIQQGADIDIAGFDPTISSVVTGGDAGSTEDLAPPDNWSNGEQPGRRGRGGRGALADRPEGEAQGADLPGSGAPGAPAGAGPAADPAHHIIQLPELVRLWRLMSNGQVPLVRAKMRAAGGTAYGLFRFGGGRGQIELRADIFDRVTPERKKALRAEAEQEADANAKQNLAAGNNALPTDPDDIFRQKLADERDLPENQAPAQALRTLAHEIGHAKDWLEGRTNLGRGNILGHIASFYDYLATTLGEAPSRNDVLTEADRRALRSDAEKQARREKLKDDAFKVRVAELYQKAVEAEIRRRGLVTREQIMEELKGLTKWWKPFDEALDADYTAYRFKPEELYADAISVFLNSPGELSRRAPGFTRTMLGWMEARPTFKAAYDAIQAEITAGTTHARTLRDMLDGYERGEELARERLAAGRRTWADLVTALRVAFIDTADPIYRKIKEVGERELEAWKNPRYRIEDAIYAGSTHEAYLKDVREAVLHPLVDAGWNVDLLGAYMELQRIANERSDIANPLGIDPKRAKEMLEAWEERRGPEAMAALEEARQALFRIRTRYVLEPIERSGAWGEELMRKARENDSYATFAVLDYLTSRYGSAVGPRVYRQVGTLKDVKNPFLATLQKDMSLISATLRNDARRGVVSFMREHFPAEIEPAKTRWNGRAMEAIEPSDPNKELFGYMDKGKFVGFYVDKWIAKHATHDDPAELSIMANAFSQFGAWFRTLVTDANPGFWLTNTVRDVGAATHHLYGAGYIGRRGFLQHWLRAVRPAFRSVFGLPDATVREMLAGNMLISMVQHQAAVSSEDRELDRWLVAINGRPMDQQRQAQQAGVLAAAADLARQVGTAWMGVGKGFERASQVGAYTWLKQHHPELTREEMAHLVRQVASPAFLRRGSLYPIYNNIFLFSNAMKEGWRAELEAARRSPGWYWWKLFKYVALPAIMTYGIRSGAWDWAKDALWLVDPDDQDGEPGEAPAGGPRSLAEAYAYIPDYDLANYHCLPVGVTDAGKVVYLRLPLLEQGRFLKSLLWRVMSATVDGPKVEANPVQSTLAVWGGEVPKMHPVLTVAEDWRQYASGQTPFDAFRGRPVMDDDVAAAGGWEAGKAMLKHSANSFGLGIVYRFRTDDPAEIKDSLERALGLPVVGNTIGRFIKVSDRGLKAAASAARSEAKATDAKERIEVGRVVDRASRGDWRAEDAAAISARPDYFSRRMRDIYSRRALRDPWDREAVRARGGSEREAVEAARDEWRQRYAPAPVGE